MSRVGARLLIAGLLATLSCSAPIGTPGGEDAADGTNVSDVPRGENVSPLADVDTLAVDIHFVKPEIGDGSDMGFDGDLPPIDVKPFDDKPQCDAAPYPFGCPCEEHDDCDSNWCLEGSGGKLCSMHCYEECPGGWSCIQLPGTCPDCEFICVPDWVELCRPCTTNNECQQGGLAGGNFCVNYGPEGFFCGAKCSSHADCPDGFSCNQVETKGSQTLQCVPADEGLCECSALATSQQASTSCFNSSTYGKCEGERFCGHDGLTVCDALVPYKESCDGVDNDCDGQIDEDIDICDGGKVCKCLGASCSCVCPQGLIDCGDGECTDLDDDIENCSECGKPCVAPNVETYVCQAGECNIVKCMAGFENFNGDYEDGCECVIQPEICDGLDNDCDGAVDEGEEACPGLEGCSGNCVEGECECGAGCTWCDSMCVPDPESFFYDPKNCGYCGNTCDLDNTDVHGCEFGLCYPISCDNGFADCNGLVHDGCEWTIEQEKCNCVDDDCDGEYDELPLSDCEAPKMCIDCFCQCPPDDPDYMDCGEDGCKKVASDPDHCGWCGNVCSEIMQWPNVKKYGCEASQCTIVGCDNDFFDTNGMPWDGCECEQTATTELCDLVDNDCDGEIDEPPLTDCLAPKQCEFGFCACPLDEPNLQECVEGQCIDVYTNPKHCGFCGNNCVDLAWENVMQYGCADGMCNIVACTPPWVSVNAMDFDGCECEKTSATEMCDFLDNDCDGEIDELPNNCIPPKICQAGQCVCPPDQPNMQDCGAGQCTDTFTDTKNCGFCGNICNLDNVAFQKCEAGQCVVAACKPMFKDCNTIPSDGCEFEIKQEECNGFDDDCDGDVDEGAIGIGLPCESGLPGLCANGIQQCENGGLVCKPNIQPDQYPEVCDGKDNNCDGQIDEGNPGGGGPCTVQGLKGECKFGVLECINTSLGCQQTVFAQPESCDGKDNDCDGVVDGMQEDCFTMCGEGKKTCTNGNWGLCSAMAPKNCKNWDTCGMEDMCLAVCPPAPKEECNGMDDNCDNQVDETYQCSPGEQKDTSCGNCGTKYSTCTNNCTWGAWGICQGEGECTPNQSKFEGDCGNCGQAKYTCSNSCFWDYSGCVNEGQCSPGSTKEEGNCGNCGEKQYSCTNSCTWTYQGCVDEGVCNQGSYKTEGSCGDCGDQKWKCDSNCEWDEYDCVSEGVCSPNQVKYDGSCGDCGDYKYECSGSCSWVKKSGCYHEGGCSPGSVVACDGCRAKKCLSNCSWSSCGYEDACGGQGEGGCWCDPQCVSSDDCCPGSGSGSACNECGYGCNSCEDETECGGSGGNCYCDDFCIISNDCCNNSRNACGVQTCTNACGQDLSSGCDCDWNCGWPTQGPCCSDKGDLCD